MRIVFHVISGAARALAISLSLSLFPPTRALPFCSGSRLGSAFAAGRRRSFLASAAARNGTHVSGAGLAAEYVPHVPRPWFSKDELQGQTVVVSRRVTCG
jgi:hypothetical protein